MEKLTESLDSKQLSHLLRLLENQSSKLPSNKQSSKDAKRLQPDESKLLQQLSKLLRELSTDLSSNELPPALQAETSSWLDSILGGLKEYGPLLLEAGKAVATML